MVWNAGDRLRDPCASFRGRYLRGVKRFVSNKRDRLSAHQHCPVKWTRTLAAETAEKSPPTLQCGSDPKPLMQPGVSVGAEISPDAFYRLSYPTNLMKHRFIWLHFVRYPGRPFEVLCHCIPGSSQCSLDVFEDDQGEGFSTFLKGLQHCPRHTLGLGCQMSLSALGPQSWTLPLTFKAQSTEMQPEYKGLLQREWCCHVQPIASLH